MKSRIPASVLLILGLAVPAARATITTYAEYHLGEAGSLGSNNLPQDTSGNGRNFTSAINGGYTSVGNAAFHALAANSTAYLDTSLTGNEGFYSSALFTSLPTDNFAFGVFVRAASQSGTTGDIFTVGGTNGSLKLSLGANGWAASAHNVAWIGQSSGVSGSFSANTWVHLAMIRSGGTTTFYIDGVSKGTYTGTPVNDTPHLSVDPGGGNYFDGQIDEARVVTFDAGTAAADVLGALQVGSRVPNQFVNEGPKGAYYAADLSTDLASSFRLGGTGDFVKVMVADKLSVVAGTAPTHVINITKQGPIAVGTYPLIDYSGTIGGLGFSGFSLGTLPGRLTASLVENTTNTTIDLDVTASTDDHITWTAAAGNSWDVETSANWQFTTGGGATAFYTSDTVTFDDSAPSGAVVVTGAVQPASVTVNNATLDYSFSGDPIVGSTGLTKTGAATLVVSNTNTYTGGTTLNGGTLRLLGTGALGSGTITDNAALVLEPTGPTTLANVINGAGSVDVNSTGILTLSGASNYTGATTVVAGTVKSGNNKCFGASSTGTTVLPGATLDVNGIGFGSETITVSGTGIGGAGAVVNSGALQLNGLLHLTLAGDTTIGGTGRWDVRGTGATASGNYKLTKIGANYTSFVSTAVDIKDIDIQEGMIAFEFGTNFADTNPGRIAVASGAVLGFGDHGSSIVVSKPLQMDGGTIRSTSTGSAGNCIVTSPVTLNAASTQIWSDSGATMHFSGVFSGTGSLEKTGTGTLSLEGTNTYTGNTTVTAGTLVLVQACLDDASTVSVANGAVLNLAHGTADTVASLVLGGVAQPPGTYDATSSPTFLAGTGSLVVPAVGTPFSLWMALFYPGETNDSIVGLNADPDGDGVPNAIEFLTNGDPSSRAAPGSVWIGTSGSHLVLSMAVRGESTTFAGSPSPAATVEGLTVTVQGTTDLSAFTSAVGETTFVLPGGWPASPVDGFSYHTFQLDASSGLTGAGFLRLKVE